jgi:hypothetical protein
VKQRASTALLAMSCALGCGPQPGPNPSMQQQGTTVNGVPGVSAPTPARCPAWPPWFVYQTVPAPSVPSPLPPRQTPVDISWGANTPFITSIAVGPAV